MSTPPDALLVEVRDLVKRYGRTLAVDGISLQARRQPLPARRRLGVVFQQPSLHVFPECTGTHVP